MSQTSHPRPSAPSWLDKFEQFSRIVFTYWRWLIKLIALILSLWLLDGNTAKIVASAITFLTGKSTIGSLVDKLRVGDAGKVPD